METLLTAAVRLNGLALDTDNQKIYWTQGSHLVPWKIYRANLDMSDKEEIASGAETLGIAVDNPVHLPGSIILLGSGLLGLIGINFKKRMSRFSNRHQKA